MRAEIDLTLARVRAGDRPIYGLLTWGRVAEPDLFCLRFGDRADLAAACRSPLRFVPGPVESRVRLDPDGDGRFRLPLHRLPGAEVAAGDPAGRVAWGSVVVAADEGADGVISLGTPPDLVLGASFWTLAAPQGRVAFREGVWRQDSFFYPARGCPQPPPGFSLLFPGSLLDERAPCTGAPLTATVPVPALGVPEGQAFQCAALASDYLGPPPATLPPGFVQDVTLSCLDVNTLAVVRHGACPTVSWVRLVGCRQDAFCEEAEWDLRASRPEWWPCTP